MPFLTKDPEGEPRSTTSWLRGRQVPYGARKTNWKFIAIVIILAILVGGGILGYLKYFQKEITSLIKFPEIKKLEKVIKEKPEKVEEEIATCKNIQDLNNRNECFLNLAINTRNPLVCNYLPQGFPFERYSRDLCFNALAILTNNPSLCRRDKDCPTSVFLYNTDLCTGIHVDVANYVKQGCPNETYCDLHYPLFKEKIECIKQIAIERGDFELCKKIDSEDCQKRVAIKLNSPELCRQVPYYRGSCLTELAIKNKDIKLCENRKGCIVKMALHYNNPDFCKELSEKKSQDRCYYDFGMEIGKKGICELCEKIQNVIAKRYCILNVAATSESYEFCEGLDIGVEDLTAKYTDKDFNFSFYYPKSFGISESKPNEYFPAGDIYLTKVGPYDDIIIIRKYIGQRVEDSDAKFGKVAYYYDEDKKQWMKDLDTDYESGVSAAEPRFYTVSGLPVFPGTGRWATRIVALSIDKFLIINITGSGWTRVLDALTKTVVKTDQKVEDKKLEKILMEEILNLEEIF